MAMGAQGIQIHRLSSAADASLTTDITIAATAINDAGAGSDYVAAGFTTAMWIKLSTQSTELHRIKTVASTRIAIHGSFLSPAGATDVAMSGYASTYIGEIVSFSGPGGQSASIDVTGLQSTAKEFVIGLRDEGQFSLSMNFNATDDGQTKLRSDRAARTPRLYTIIFTDISSGSSAYPSWCYFNGYCMQFSVSGGVDNKVTADAVIQIDGPVIYSTAVTV